MTLIEAFIHPNNQTILWSILEKQPIFQQIQIDREAWFSNRIQMVYEQSDKNNQVKISLYTDLKKFNIQVLEEIMRDLKQMVEQQEKNRPVETLNRGQTLENLIDKETKMKFEYEKDEPIKNIEELVLEQRLARESAGYILPTHVSAPTPSPVVTATTEESSPPLS